MNRQLLGGILMVIGVVIGLAIMVFAPLFVAASFLAAFLFFIGFLLMGGSTWLKPFIPLSILVFLNWTISPSFPQTWNNILTSVFAPGGPLNLCFDFYGLILGNLVPIVAVLVLMFGISLTIVAGTSGNWRTYGEHLLWLVGIGLGLFFYVIPGLIIWGAMAYYKGWGSAALVLLGPVGSAIVASSPPLANRWMSSAVPLFPTGLGAGQGIFTANVSGAAVGLTLLVLFAVLGALGVLSATLWAVSPWLHVFVYFTLAVGLAVAIVQFTRTTSVKWLIGGIAVFVLMVSIADIMVNAMSFVGAMVPRAVPGGLTGGLAGGGAVLLSILSGPLLGALIGQFLSEQGWTTRRITFGVMATVLTVLLFLIAIGGV